MSMDTVSSVGRRRDGAVLALGSNIADRLGHLRAAVASIAAEHGIIAASGVYETAPVGGPEQDDYLNAVVLVPPARPRELLDLARRCETRAHRVRTRRWGPRTLDVDVIACGDVRSEDPEILLPHPRAHERAFVCVPWLEVDPGAVLTGRGRLAGLVAAMVADGRAAGVRRTDHDLLAGSALPDAPSAGAG
jgi:dihydroneopterin aldolase/2-amino-4-hydroxy-6-hydroxymethyldihydropteridine diphosphokinase